MAVSIQTDAEPIPGYRLLDRLGSGGFGEVWRCVAPGGIYKAVKVIHGDIRQTEDDGHRFAEQELKALKRVKTVRHPYLLALDRFDIVDGRLMIVMELADRNLWDRFRECRGQGLPGIPREELLGYMGECAEVLDLMNGHHSLQHLDIKPQNLFLLYNHVKVADFGQVKDLEKHVAQVTGGITPVYAAPETFDGFVSRYCDQYSLAIVYQELLTGQRPFDGQSMQQLLMQHLQAPPDLSSSPPADRPALARALAKSPDDRFPTIAALVAALRTGSVERVAVSATIPARVAVGAATESEDWRDQSGSCLYPRGGGWNPAEHAGADSGDGIAEAVVKTYFPRQPAEATVAPLERTAPPEQLGDGPIRPALVLGVGYTGFRVVQRLRHRLSELYGRAERLPAIRALYLDTDPEALDEAVSGTNGFPLPPDAVVPLRLNRSAHYLKPRTNGRMLIEGWFDPQLLYKLPRVPVSMGVRSLGRLAFCDHYRATMQKLSAELDAALAPEAVAATCGVAGQALRTNCPRVYVVAGLGGGTGGGLSLDLAYAVRAKLKRIGYANPDVVAVFLTPADAAGDQPTDHARANTYATLTELHHYSHPDTAYIAHFDDRHGNIVDNDPPFSRVHLMPGLPYRADGEPGGGGGALPFPTVRGSGITTTPPARRGGTPTGRSGAHRRLAAEADSDPIVQASEFLRLDLFTLVGVAADTAGRPPPAPDVVRAFGLRRFGWPRAAVVGRVARLVSPVLLGHWVAPDPAQLRAVVSKWTGDVWQRLGLNPDRLTARLGGIADTTAGMPIDEWARRIAEPFAQKGWRSRSPDPAQVARATDQMTAAIGPPRENSGRHPTILDDALNVAAAAVATAVVSELSRLIPQLHDTPEFRVAGTEEAVRQLLVAVDRSRGHLEPLVAKWEASASAAYDRLKHASFLQKGVRKANAAEVADAFHAYPTDWVQVLTGRRAVSIYSHLHEMLLSRLSELSACRQRLEELHVRLLADAERPATPAAGLLPVGCLTVEDAARKFAEVLNDDDLAELERRFQAGLEEAFGGVFEASLNSAEGPETVHRILREATCEYLDGRLGEVDLAGMVKQKFGSSAGVREELQRMYDQSEPAAVGGGPWAKAEVTVFATPPRDGGAPLRQLAGGQLPPTAVVTETHDEVVVYREYPNVPLTAVPQLGPAWETAYQNFRDFLDTTPHTRADITQWLPVDG